MIPDFSAREKECFDFLNFLKKDMEYVVIGGYAVSSFGFPRFSMDLDIIVTEKKNQLMQKLIKEKGFILETEKKDLNYSGKFERYSKGLVSIDLFINTVQSRQTGYCYPFSYIFKNSEIREVSGWDPLSNARVRVPHKEMLIALKIHSMRTADKRDIIMLCYEKPSTEKIVNHLKNCPQEKIIAHINELLGVIGSQNLKDSLKGVFSLGDKVFTKAVSNCIITLERIKEELSKL
jgi:hypothetical protein